MVIEFRQPMGKRNPDAVPPNIDTSGNSPSLTPAELGLARLEERMGWHGRIGWGAIGVLIFLLVWIFLHLPSKIKEDNRDQIKVGINDALQPLNQKFSDMSERLA